MAPGRNHDTLIAIAKAGSPGATLRKMDGAEQIGSLFLLQIDAIHSELSPLTLWRPTVLWERSN